MIKLPEKVQWIATVFGTLGSLLSTPWAALAASLIATAAALVAAGVTWLEKPLVQSLATAFLAVLWTWIGITWLFTRRRPIEIFPKKDFRYGLTFEGLSANFDPRYEEASLQHTIMLRNYSPGALSFVVEQFKVKIDSRSVELENGKPMYLPRGAGRPYHCVPFKGSHIKEFFGTRQEGVVSFSIAYGDVEGSLSRRFKMSFRAFYVFPPAEAISSTPIGVPLEFGFNSLINSEGDTSIDK